MCENNFIIIIVSYNNIPALSVLNEVDVIIKLYDSRGAAKLGANILK